MGNMTERTTESSNNQSKVYFQKATSIFQKPAHELKFLQTVKHLSNAKNQKPKGDGMNLIQLMDIIPGVTTLVKIPLNKMIAPIYICFNYFIKNSELLAPSMVDMKVFLSLTDRDPSKATNSNVMIKQQP